MHMGLKLVRSEVVVEDIHLRNYKEAVKKDLLLTFTEGAYRDGLISVYSERYDTHQTKVALESRMLSKQSFDEIHSKLKTYRERLSEEGKTIVDIVYQTIMGIESSDIIK